MNVWYLNPYSGGPGVGMAFRSYHLARAFRTAGHDMTVITSSFHHLLDSPEPLEREFELDDVRYLTVPTRRYSGNGLGRILNMIDYARGVANLDALADQRLPIPDAIIVSSPHPFAFPGAHRLAHRLKCRLAYEVRDIWPLSLTEILGTPRAHPLVLALSLLERTAYRRSDLIASLLPGVGRHVEETIGRSRPFVWVPNGVVDGPTAHDASFSATGRQIRDQIRAWRSQGHVVAVFAGTIGPTTGVSLLVEGAARAVMKAGGDRLRVAIFGKGPHHAQVAKAARVIPGEVVRVWGPVCKSEAVALINESDFGYGGGLPHDRLYGYGTSQNKLMDYMQCGLPVVLPIKSYRNPVGESGAGVALDQATPETVAEAMLRLVALPASERRRLGQAGRDYVRAHYSWDVVVSRYVDALQGLR